MKPTKTLFQGNPSDLVAEEPKPHDLGAVWELLHKVDKNLTVHMAQYNEDLPKIREIITLLDRGKGVVIFIIGVSAVAGAVVAAFAWLKSHVTL